jgi:hypothetical protein
MMLMELLLSVARTAGPAQARKSDEVHSKRKAIGERERPSTGNKTGNFAFLVQNTNLKPLCLKAKLSTLANNGASEIYLSNRGVQSMFCCHWKLH